MSIELPIAEKPVESLQKIESRSNFQWDETRLKAACLFADGKTVTEVADMLSVPCFALHSWRENPEFDRRVGELALTSGLADAGQQALMVRGLLDGLLEEIRRRLENPKTRAKIADATLFRAVESSLKLLNELVSGGKSSGAGGKNQVTVEIVHRIQGMSDEDLRSLAAAGDEILSLVEDVDGVYREPANGAVKKSKPKKTDEGKTWLDE